MGLWKRPCYLWDCKPSTMEKGIDKPLKTGFSTVLPTPFTHSRAATFPLASASLRTSSTSPTTAAITLRFLLLQTGFFIGSTGSYTQRQNRNSKHCAANKATDIYNDTHSIPPSHIVKMGIKISAHKKPCHNFLIKMAIKAFCIRLIIAFY